jgi:hypothetical protein
MFCFAGITGQVSLKMAPMEASLPPKTDITILDLLERERAIRIFASAALTPEESTVLLRLVDYYETLIAERQNGGAASAAAGTGPPHRGWKN